MAKTPTIDLAEFTHKIRLPDGWFLIFKADACERCGGVVQKPNALKVRPSKTSVLDTLVETDQEPPEIWPCDKCGGYYCGNCHCCEMGG